jgi:hypothetical protein
MKDKQEIKLYFCPSCKSKEVGFIFTFRNAFGVIPRMRCRDCEYESMMFPIIAVNLDKLNKLEQRRKK